MDLLSSCEHRTGVISLESSRYIAQHPELKQMLHDFMATVLSSKPADVPAFASAYFSKFLPDPDADAELEPLDDDEPEDQQQDQDAAAQEQ